MAGPPLAAAKQAAASFVKAKRKADSMSIYSFGHEANPVHGLDTDINALGSSMNQVTLDTVQGTALYDSVIQASSELGTAPTLTKVLVVLTDGDDTTHTKLGAAVKAAKAGNVAIDAIAIGSGDHAGAQVARPPDRRPRLRSRPLGRRHRGRVQADRRGDPQHLPPPVPLDAPTASCRSRSSLKGYTAATQKMDLTAPAAEIVAAGGTISKISKHSSSGLALAIVIGLRRARPGAVPGAHPARDGARTPPRPLHDGRARAARRGARRRASRCATCSCCAVSARSAARPTSSASRSCSSGPTCRCAQPSSSPSRRGCIVALGLVGFVLGLGIIFPLVFAIIGAVIPEFIVRRKANARRKKFEDQLGDTLTAVASSLRAGQSFQQAMSTISLDGPEPISKEFQRVETETRLGRPADEALQSMADRLGSKNFEFVVLAVNIQRQVGGSLSEILDMVADTVRGRVQFSRKVRALTAMGRASAYVLVGMPFALAFMISLVDRSYLRPLWATSAGHLMIIIGLISMCFGGIVTRKIVNFKY